ncbi:MAG: hypothetical protein HKN39_08125 [Flavobacteriales bacterium]|nr:hypothetical protein [Flavobacteriales bacterium]
MLPPNRFAIKLVVFSLLLVIGFLLIDRYLFLMPSNSILYYSAITFFIVLSFLIYRYLFTSYNGKPTAFVNRFMASLMIKLFLFVIICIVSGFSLPKIEVKSFIIFLICIYISYTIFMTYHLMVNNDGTKEKAQV